MSVLLTVPVSMGGLHREASRGFDFNMEEGGVAVSLPPFFSKHRSRLITQVQRMQSRLSERSGQGHRSKRFLPTLAPMNKSERKPSNATPFGISRIRERAGSVFSRKRAGTDTSHPLMPGTATAQDSPAKTRTWGRRGTHETGDSAEGPHEEGVYGNGRRRPKGEGNDDPARPGEEGGLEDTGSRAGVGEDPKLWGPKVSAPEQPRA